MSFTPWIPSWFACFPSSVYIYVLTSKSPLLQQFPLGRKRVWTLQCRDIPCWLPWCGTSGCVGWWIDGGMWWVTVEFCLPVSCRDSSYGLTSFPSCQFLENTQEFSLSFQFLWSTWSKNLGGEKYTNTKKSNHKQQQTYSNTEKCRKLLFCLFIWECLPFLRMLISKFI